MIRFIKELFNQKLKCQRLGHKMKTICIKIRKDGVGFREVVTDYKAEKDYCERCGGEHSEYKNLKYIQGYTKCSMPSDMWDSIREKGYVEI